MALDRGAPPHLCIGSKLKALVISYIESKAHFVLDPSANSYFNVGGINPFKFSSVFAGGGTPVASFRFGESRKTGRNRSAFSRLRVCEIIEKFNLI